MPSVEISQVLDALDKFIADAGGVPALAKRLKVSPQYLYMVKNEDVLPSRKLLKKLGFDIEKQYVRVEA